MPNTIGSKFGDVVLVPFPFTDQTAAKRRPAIIVSSDAYHSERPVFTTIEQTLILRKLGTLQGPDVTALREALQVVLG